jgi:hypothetical protein
MTYKYVSKLKRNVRLFSAGVSKVKEIDAAGSNRCRIQCDVAEVVGSVWVNYVTSSA